MSGNLTFTSPPSPCDYLPDRVQQLRYEVAPWLRPAGYMERMHDGWRRFGYVVFRPECPSCRMCQSLRVPLIAAARERGVPHVYLGYYVQACRSLAYKARFRPNEVQIGRAHV